MKRSARPVIVTPLEWRSLTKQGQVAGIARTALIERAADGAVSFIASAFEPDRYGDTIDQTGWVLANFEANPVLLWAHSHDCPPVGRVGKITAPAEATGRLLAEDVTFTPKEMHAFGDEVGQMVKGGFLNAVSVGFMPLEWEERYDETGRFLGYHFKRMELLELSVVPVPAQPQALQLSKGFAKSLAQWLEKPDESSPLARGYQQELGGFFKAIEEIEARSTDAADEAGFGKMVALLERIAAASEKQVGFAVKLGDLEVRAPTLEGCQALLRSVERDVEVQTPAAEEGSLLLALAPEDPAPVVPEASVGEDATNEDLAALSSLASE